MTIQINGELIEVNPTIRTFVEVVDYMRMYERHRNMNLTKYLNQMESDEYELDLVCDLIFYPYALSCRKRGLLPNIEYSHVFEWLVMNKEQAKVLAEELKEAMPTPEENKSENVVKQAKKKRD